MYIYSQQCAAWLMLNKFVLQGMERSRDGKRNVFIFNDSEDLTNKVNEYKQNKQKLMDFLTQS